MGLLEFLKKNKILIMIFLFLFFISPFLVHLLVTIENPFGIGFINDSNRDSWINFFGAIIGGFTTLYGVWWTIQNQKEEKKEELIAIYKPIITIEDRFEWYLNKNKTDLACSLFIKNIGRGEAISIYATCHSDDPFQSNIIAELPINILNIGDSFELRMSLGKKGKKLNENVYEAASISNKNLKSYVEITYLDTFNNKYIYNVDVSLSYYKSVSVDDLGGLNKMREISSDEVYQFFEKKNPTWNLKTSNHKYTFIKNK